MHEGQLSRRAFLKNSSWAGMGAIAGTCIAGRPSAGESAGTSKILNYNSKMHYRRLGKTELVLSEIGTGGHWKAPWQEQTQGWWWGKFIDNKSLSH